MAAVLESYRVKLTERTQHHMGCAPCAATWGRARKALGT